MQLDATAKPNETSSDTNRINASQAMFAETLKDAKRFLEAMNKHVPAIDKNGDKSVSQEELTKYANNSNTDQEGKYVASYMLKNFTVFAEMATFMDAPESINMWGTQEARQWYLSKFGGDGDFRRITRKDLEAVNYLIGSRSEYERDLQRFKSMQTIENIMNAGLAAGTAVAVVAGELAMPYAGLVLSPILLWGIERADRVYRGVTVGTGDVLTEQVDRRRRMLASAGLVLK